MRTPPHSHHTVDRRRFLATLAAASLAPRPAWSQQPIAALALLPDPGATIPTDFTGLSYESAQLANPEFFSPRNIALIDIFRQLSPSGNLRLGGGSSEFTTYSNADPTSAPPFEVFGPDTSKTVKTGTTTTALALRNLRGFLDATNWSCLYGLNLGQGTKENAAAEAAAAHRILGPRLLAFQIGNEPDSFRNRYRPASYGPADFLAEWNTFHNAIVALTLDQLFEPEPRLATMHQHNLEDLFASVKAAHLPFRMSEGNSCWDGGKPGVSDTLASALWCADMMLRFAQYGWVGVNLHGGGNGFYTPISGAPSTGFTRRPEFFGMEFAQALTGARFLGCSLTDAPPRITAYAFDHHGRHRVAIFNKRDVPLPLTLPNKPAPRALTLTGPGFASKEGVTLTTTAVPATRLCTVPPRTAILYDL